MLKLLEITWKNILHSNPLQKLRLVVVILNLKLEVMQPSPKPLWNVVFLLNYSNLETLPQCYLFLWRSYLKVRVFLHKSVSFVLKRAMKNANEA